MQEKHYEVAIIGGGITGAALFYEIARYTNIKNIVLLEKYEGLSTLNSKATSNSQTLHNGDIETNYTIEKAKSVKKRSDMIVKYCLNNGYDGKFLFSEQKMALGIGAKEVSDIKERFEEFKEIYSYLELFDKQTLKEVEPRVVFDGYGNERNEDIIAMGVKKGVSYTTIDFGALTTSFVDNAQKEPNKICDVFLNSQVENIEHIGDKFYIKTQNRLSISADFVVVDAGAHSLWLAHKMGYGRNLGCLSVAGSFYMTKQKILNGKVYMIQNPKLPFAALHGDPDILAGGCTRFGPTALPMPKLERYHGLKSVREYFQTLNFKKETVSVIVNLLKDSDIRNYLLRNIGFELPIVGKKLFVEDARKIVPSLREEDICFAKNFGGIRPQVVDLQAKKLLFGEASINTKKGIIFNMTPSPGATSCLANAQKDIEEICEFLGKTFDEVRFNSELTDERS